MLRRFITLLLTLTVALGGLTSAACASGRCAMMQQRMRCCEDGLHAERSCCGRSAQLAAPQAPAALERPASGGAFVALPLAPLALASLSVGRGPITALPIPISHAPPPTLIAQHTSLLL
jgi:hypothetical protein